MSPKRQFFSLNLDSAAEHPATDDQSSLVTQRHTDFSTITKPFERTVNRAVDDIVKDTGKKVDSVEGNVHYTSNSSSSNSSTGASNLNVKSNSTRRYLERRYDTSDL
ncbi:hypothetical protein HBI56_149290 [Parastagonospora nodorum]|uniref:Uncharacterized protein n=1 Tax=Phaeosphaeria nodorum (strain SN15 / ATCC MYA-4574 / FGSC 10173) TaxID=321614 RepID=A0A7U2NQJ6_PHANO|nr:hypothetical protein HBH56_075570 [Parastagonospora nodorum]QRD06827.1 hypothetical protein JI435_446460 [Parastagonospora nodorum SN15]KAH3927250.1 hypothetical protein HBH54_155810 [Parastagonospora nodorum]KAH3983014.1 hypothetical protein HBH52_070040 [Parastagonospora nodorum]KAH3995708.1 hypothetical protein HBI10_170120 [Parastagonospora nodorum]